MKDAESEFEAENEKCQPEKLENPKLTDRIAFVADSCYLRRAARNRRHLSLPSAAADAARRLHCRRGGRKSTSDPAAAGADRFGAASAAQTSVRHRKPHIPRYSAASAAVAAVAAQSAAASPQPQPLLPAASSAASAASRTHARGLLPPARLQVRPDAGGRMTTGRPASAAQFPPPVPPLVPTCPEFLPASYL